MVKLPTSKLRLLEENLTKWLGKQYFLDKYDSNLWEGDYPEATHYVDCPDTAYDDAAHAIEESGWKILAEVEFQGSDYDGVTFYIKEADKTDTPTKTYKVVYKATSLGVYFVDADSEEKALAKFEKASANGEINFSDMKIDETETTVKEMKD